MNREIGKPIEKPERFIEPIRDPVPREVPVPINPVRVPVPA